MPRFSEILKVAKLSGCKKFIEAIEKYGITKEIDNYVAMNRTVTLFCPLDSALENFTLYPSDKVKKAHVREVLRHHVAVKHDSHGTMYHSVTKHGRIAMHPTFSNKQEVIRLLHLDMEWLHIELEKCSDFIDALPSFSCIYYSYTNNM